MLVGSNVQMCGHCSVFVLFRFLGAVSLPGIKTQSVVTWECESNWIQNSARAEARFAIAPLTQDLEPGIAMSPQFLGVNGHPLSIQFGHRMSRAWVPVCKPTPFVFATRSVPVKGGSFSLRETSQ